MNTATATLTRPARISREVRDLLTLALPIIIGQLATTAMSFVDAVMAGRVSPQDLAAVGLGNSIWIPVYLLMTGTLLATTPKVAQRYGAGKYSEIGPLVRQSLWLAVVVGITGALLLLCAEPVLHAMKVEPALIEPSMGGVGCGWATAIAMWVMMLGLAGWTRWGPAYQSSELFKRFDWPQWAVIKRVLGIGLPIGVAIFAESSIFAVIALLLGSLGATVVSGHQIALNVSSLVFMIPYSLSMAVTVRVGQALGRGEPREARFAAGVGMGTALAYACLSCSLMLVFREQIAAIYTPDPVVIHLASMLIVFSALFQFSDSIQVTAAGALRGYQDTRVTMLLTLFAYWGVGLPVGYALGLTDWLGEPSGPSGLWQGLIVGLSCAAGMLLVRLARSARRRIHADKALTRAL
ncbi:MATE family efflux transporter [Pseudomonas sp. R3-18-08]|uniref:MATE family efflux transporter n=1 Tax=Pseudomonas sp. R3-18-08 TaxID=1173283 RepID=UPI000F55E3A0|nr:MATE family efflux transporter [Pseudomonas sp. R3-18-08]AZF15006.1 Multi antimicrobial extrusion protein (Na(+)/drug antiporter), MATE family of MDR efflux pump [Pseudomonas sp. R3-18-08]